MSLKNLIRCIRQVHSTGNGYPQMRACLFNFTLCDSLAYPSIDIQTSKVLINDPMIQLFCFNNFEQEVSINPGLVAIIDGKCLVGRMETLKKNDTIIITRYTSVKGLTEQSAFLYINSNYNTPLL